MLRGSAEELTPSSGKADSKIYCLKALSMIDLKREEQLQILSEVKILASLDNESIVRYYDCFIDSSTLYIVMEWLPNGTLSQRVASGRLLPEETIWRFFIQTLIGLHHIHSRAILHRDIKLSNLLLDAADNVKIADFGVARVLSPAQQFASTIVGTPYYLSPEMCDEQHYNDKSDVWALGVCLYELAALSKPFEAKTHGALILKILRAHYKPLPPRYSPELAATVAACLARDRKQRPSTGQLLASPAIQGRAAALGIPLPLSSPVPHRPSPAAPRSLPASARSLAPPSPSQRRPDAHPAASRRRSASAPASRANSSRPSGPSRAPPRPAPDHRPPPRPGAPRASARGPAPPAAAPGLASQRPSSASLTQAAAAAAASAAGGGGSAFLGRAAAVSPKGQGPRSAWGDEAGPAAPPTPPRTAPTPPATRPPTAAGPARPATARGPPAEAFGTVAAKAPGASRRAGADAEAAEAAAEVARLPETVTASPRGGEKAGAAALLQRMALAQALARSGRLSVPLGSAQRIQAAGVQQLFDAYSAAQAFPAPRPFAATPPRAPRARRPPPPPSGPSRAPCSASPCAAAPPRPLRPALLSPAPQLVRAPLIAGARDKSF
eukprot:tig00001292_g8044.t1